ncbi:oligosaccharide flippase family protein [Lachnospiraceae bacterium C1.1]|nr:oligosaccharide flippase family protein [Lachnospiraceae bacterium C1.1]
MLNAIITLMKTPSIKKNIILSTCYQILTFLTPLLTAPYISRVIGGDGVGIYSYTASVQMYFSLIAALGTASYGLREISRARDDREKRTILFWQIETLSIIVSVACLIGWGIFVYFQSAYRLIYIILTLNILNTMLDISWFYDGLEQFSYTVTKNSIVKIAGVFLIFIFVRDKNDLAIYVFIMSITTLLGTMSMWLTLPGFISRVKIKKIDLGQHFHETLIYFIPTIATSVYTVLDKTLIGLITKDAYQNGYYEQATKIINMVKVLSFASLNSVLQARISYLFAEKKFDEIKGRISQSMNFILLMGTAACFGIIGVATRFVPLFFGPGYEPVIGLLSLLSPIVLIIGISNCLGSQYYTPGGYRALSAKFIIAGAVTNLIMNIVLIPKLAATGAVIGSLAAELIITILYMNNDNGYYRWGQLLRDGWKKIISGIIMMFVVYNIGKLIASPLLSLIAQVAAGAAVYIVCLILLRDEFLLSYGKEQITKVINKFNKNSR